MLTIRPSPNRASWALNTRRRRFKTIIERDLYGGKSDKLSEGWSQVRQVKPVCNFAQALQNRTGTAWETWKCHLILSSSRPLSEDFATCRFNFSTLLLYSLHFLAHHLSTVSSSPFPKRSAPDPQSSALTNPHSSSHQSNLPNNPLKATCASLITSLKSRAVQIHNHPTEFPHSQTTTSSVDKFVHRHLFALGILPRSCSTTPGQILGR